jgi:hypothetical protein
MRYYLIRTKGFADGGPYVLAETVDQDWAESVSLGQTHLIYLSEKEAVLDPELAPVVAEWNARDDRRYASDRVNEEMEMEVIDALEPEEQGRYWEQAWDRTSEGLSELAVFYRQRPHKASDARCRGGRERRGTRRPRRLATGGQDPGSRVPGLRVGARGLARAAARPTRLPGDRPSPDSSCTFGTRRAPGYCPRCP